MKQWFVSILLVMLLVSLSIPCSSQVTNQSRKFSNGLTKQEFSELIEKFSEPDAHTRSDKDNFISNEDSYLDIFPGLLKYIDVGKGAYIGVGPDQNFTYIAQIKPQIVFIVDIRRQNLLQILLFKACFELAENRKEYLEILFARKRNSIDQLLDDPPLEFDQKLAYKLFAKIEKRLVSEDGINLSPDDMVNLQQVYRAFYTNAGEIHYYDHSGTINPLLKTLVRLKDGSGKLLNYLQNDESYDYLRKMHQKNLIIPIVGNIAGTKALPMLASWLKKQDLVVSCFYMSNVEDYLEDETSWKAWYKNLSALPLNPRSVVIRTSYENLADHPLKKPDNTWITLTYYAKFYLKLYKDHPSKYDFRYRYYLNLQ